MFHPYALSGHFQDSASPACNRPASPDFELDDDATVQDVKKRRRTKPQELAILEIAFLKEPLPDAATRLVLANQVGMEARAVQIWFQNRRQKAKRFALPEKPAKISRCASLGDALIPKRPRGPGKENIAPGTTSDAASVFRVHPTYPRSVTAPLLNEPVNIAARPSFSRPALARAHTLDPALLALADRMPDSSSSPIKFADHPYIRRSPSFTLDWAATQQSLRPISVEANVVDEGNSAALTTARAKKASTLTQLSIPSGPSPFLPTGKPQSISLSPASISGLDELLQAARQAQEPEEDESLTDEEVTVAAKKMGGHGDESFSSIGSDEASDDEEARLAASVLLGLVGGW